MQFPLKKAWSDKAKIFKQHNSLVVALPYLMKHHLDLNIGDHLEFYWHHTKPDTIVLKVIRLKS